MVTRNDSNDRSIPVAPIFVEEALACGIAAGVDVEAVLMDAGVKPGELDHLSTQAFGRVWLTLSAYMKDEFFGLGARPMRPGSATLLGHAIRGAPTLQAALHRMLRFLRVVLDDPYGVVVTDAESCTVRLNDGAPVRSAFAYRTFFLIVHGFTCWAARERVPLIHVAFPCPEPDGQNDYGAFFGVPVRFNAPVAQFSFNRKYLSRPVERSEEELKVFLRSLPEAFLRGYRDTGGIKHRIIEHCLNGPPEDWPHASAVARQLGMSRSTLHRQLRDAGQSLTQLKDEIRRNRAAALLAKTDMSVADISAAVGYTEEGAFYRAFHRWYGTTPRQLTVVSRRDR